VHAGTRTLDKGDLIKIRAALTRFLQKGINIFRIELVQNGSAAHPASYPMGIRGSFSGGKAAGA
jgi:hypothetical protein